jgi:hypothetical protein
MCHQHIIKKQHILPRTPAAVQPRSFSAPPLAHHAPHTISTLTNKQQTARPTHLQLCSHALFSRFQPLAHHADGVTHLADLRLGNLKLGLKVACAPATRKHIAAVSRHQAKLLWMRVGCAPDPACCKRDETATAAKIVWWHVPVAHEIANRNMSAPQTIPLQSTLQACDVLRLYGCGKSHTFCPLSSSQLCCE